MGSQTLDILRQGIWASLTGGWYYDPYQNIFCNTFHLYLWLLLFCLPLIIYFYISFQSVYIWACYVLCISLVVGVIKYMNLKLHKLFDTTEYILEEASNQNASQTNITTPGSRFMQSSSGGLSGVNGGGDGSGANNSSTQTAAEVIEMKDMKSVDQDEEDLPEEDEESLKYNPDGGSKPSGAANTTANYKVDVHRKNSTSASSNSEYSELPTFSKSSSIPKISKVDSADGEKSNRHKTRGELMISPGTSDEFCVGARHKKKMSGGVGGSGACGCVGGNAMMGERRRKTDQRSNSIDVFFSNNGSGGGSGSTGGQNNYMKAIPSTSTSSAFELSSPSSIQQHQSDQCAEKGLMFWNTNNQWDREQSVGADIHHGVGGHHHCRGGGGTSETGGTCDGGGNKDGATGSRGLMMSKRSGKSSLELEFSFPEVGSGIGVCSTGSSAGKKSSKLNSHLQGSNSSAVYSIDEKNESLQTQSQPEIRARAESYGKSVDKDSGDEEEDDDLEDEDDESKSPLIRKRGDATSISMCSVDRQSCSKSSTKLNKQDSINSKDSSGKYSFDSIDKPASVSFFDGKSAAAADKQSISYDVSSFDSVDSTSSTHRSCSKESPNPSMYCHVSIQNSQKESSLSGKSPGGSVMALPASSSSSSSRSSFQKGSNPSLTSKDQFEEEEDEEGSSSKQRSPSVEFVNERRRRPPVTKSSVSLSSSSVSRSSADVEPPSKLELPEKAESAVGMMVELSSPSIGTSRQQGMPSKDLNDLKRTGSSCVVSTGAARCSKERKKLSSKRSRKVKSENTSHESVRSLQRSVDGVQSEKDEQSGKLGGSRGEDEEHTKQQLCKSIDFELDWLFEHTDSENDDIKQQIWFDVLDENSSYANRNKDGIVNEGEKCDSLAGGGGDSKTCGGVVKSDEKGKVANCDDDDEDDDEEPNDQEILVLNIKKKKRNRRERRHFNRRSLHLQSNVAGLSSSNHLGASRKLDGSSSHHHGGTSKSSLTYKLHQRGSSGASTHHTGGMNNVGLTYKMLEPSYHLHDSLYKNSQQSEDDYDDDVYDDEDVYMRTKSSNSTENSSNQISHKEMLQIFLANKPAKWNNDEEVFKFRHDEDGSMTSGLGSCISTSPVPIHPSAGPHHPTSDSIVDSLIKIERHRNGRHSRTSRRQQHHGRIKHFSSRSHRRNPLIRSGLQSAMSSSASQVTSLTPYQIQVPSGTHLAASYNDTTEGAVHIFRDENGELMSYMFDEKGLGLAQNIRTDDRNKALKVLIDQQQTQTSSSTPIGATGVNQSGNSVQPLSDPSNNSSASTSGENVSSRLLPIVPANSAAANVPITQLTQGINGSFLIESFLPLSGSHRHLNINPNALRVIFSENSPTRLLEGDPITDPLEDIRTRFHLMDSLMDTTSRQQQQQHQQEPKRYYQLSIFPFTNVKVHFNRLMLLSLLDHNFTLFYTVLCLFLTVFVAVFGSWLLYLNFYKDIHVFIFCFVIAGCQYSMLKSVQPDASSPTHGFNKIIIFSRPVYFIVVSFLVLILHYSLVLKPDWTTFTVYNIDCDPKAMINLSKDFLVSFLLYFPLVFSFGLFPQVNTFLMYFLEQIDIYVFGGNASCSVISAIYCIFRSALSVLLLYGFAYAGLSEPKSSQHIWFSIYCGLIVATSYHLSRSSSDPLPIWNIIKKYLCPIEEDEVTQVPERKKKKKTSVASAGGGATSSAAATGASVRKERKTSSISRHDETLKDDKDTADIVLPMDTELHDPLPMKLVHTMNARLKSDLIICTLVSVFVFGIHCSTVFSALQPLLNHILWSITISLGILLHYVFPHLRKQLPWLCIARPVLKSNEYSRFEVRFPAKIMWFEKLYVYLCFLERNIVYPVLFIAAITDDAPKLVTKFGLLGGSLILTICALKCLRSSFSDPSGQYLVLSFSILFRFDFANQVSETFLLDFCVTSILFCKCYEFLLKIQFVVTYIAPWQITWGSAFHAFAQPFSVPHSAMMFLQAFISAILSAPLYPFLGSAIFISSYPRPVKFWERDYNTKRSDHSNTRLVTQFDRTLGSDDNNLNSIFYEHLTRSLQHSLCGDLLLGRWGSVSQGDCFVLASDYLNCLIHIVEIGNGLVTFQMRGLEFRGTYCQQREVEAISESVDTNEGCCCCEPGHLPNLLSLNAAFSQRWLAWEVTTTKYVLEGYSISDNSAASMLQVFDFRKVLISYYVRSIVFYVANSAKLEEWLSSPTILAALQPTTDRSFVDLDPVFNMNIDEDYDFRLSGITRASFCSNYLDWIQYCASKRKSLKIKKSKDSNFVSLCFALSLLGRRTLGAASHNTLSSVEFFLYGLHALFKGDFRITCERDEWIFTDMDLLKKVVAPAVKMSLKLHQDHFTSPDDYQDLATLYNAIAQHHEKLVISHEGDPMWRNAVLSGTPSLLALRHVLDDGVDEYKVIMLNKRYLSFRIIKMNRECVRGLWAGQQQELVYLRNRNPERGSIQNAKQALRNIINSSCDQPIGYPIFVSPLTTSYAETNEQLSSIVGGSLSLGAVKRAVVRFWRRIQRRCIEGCSSGGNVGHEDGGFGHDGVFAMTTFNIHAGYPGTHSIESNITMSGGGSISRGNRSSLASIGKPSSSTLASLAGLLSSAPSEASNVKHPNASTATLPSSNCDNASANPSESIVVVTGGAKEMKDKTDTTATGVGVGGGSGTVAYERVRIVDPYQVYDALNLGRRIDVMWPDEKMRQRGGRTFWKDWLPEIGMEGQVVHKWVPNHRDPSKRSNVDRTILLIKIDDKYVPISESGVQNLDSVEAEKG